MDFPWISYVSDILSCLAALRVQFLMECLVDLKQSLMKRGLNLFIKHGKPEQILPSLAEAYGVHTVKETFI